MGNKLTKCKNPPPSPLSVPILDKDPNHDPDHYPNQIELEDQLPESRIILGCRSPQSTGAGKWDGAFVYIYQNRTKRAIIYDNNMEYISPNIPLEKAIKIYNEYLKHHWVEMTEEDILKTAKMQ
jgi:hypothetical protein